MWKTEHSPPVIAFSSSLEEIALKFLTPASELTDGKDLEHCQSLTHDGKGLLLEFL